MQVGLIAEAEIRIPEKHPAVSRLAVLPVQAVWGYAASTRSAGRDILVGLLLVSWLIQVDYRFTHWRSHG